MTTPRARTARRAVGLLMAGGTTLAATMMAAAPAFAAPTTTLVYSTDGGTTWTATPTVASGGQVLARLFYDNDTTGTIAASQVSTSLPAGFSLVAGSTEVCLNPGTTDPTNPTSETACNTDTGQGGPIDESAVWSGGTLTISPTAGIYGQPTNATTGDLAMGKTKFINLDNCDWTNGTTDNFVSTVPLAAHTAFSAGTNTSDAATTLNCGAGGGAYVLQAASSAVQNIDLLGQHWFNLEQCDYHQGPTHTNNVSFMVDDTPSTVVRTGTNASNTQVNPSNTDATAPTCGPGTAAIPLAPTGSGVLSLNLLDNRFVNIQDCSYDDAATADSYQNDVHVSSGSPQYDAGTSASNTAATATVCGPGNPTYVFQPTNSDFLALDTLDTTRGQGFVQFEVTAPTLSATTTFPQNGGLTGTGTGDPTTTGNITVTAAVGAPLADLWIAAGTLGGMAIIGSGWLARRRRRRTLA